MRGDVAAVKAAVDAGVRGAEKVGEVISTHVIARPHVNVDVVLPLGRAEEAEAEADFGRKQSQDHHAHVRSPDWEIVYKEQLRSRTGATRVPG